MAFGVLARGSYITPDYYSQPNEAGEKLAMYDQDGNPKNPEYRIMYMVKDGEFIRAENSIPGTNFTAPSHGRPGGGTEFINTVTLYPIGWEPMSTDVL